LAVIARKILSLLHFLLLIFFIKLRFHGSRLKQQIDHISPLQSWAPEMRNFEKLHQRPIENGLCDVVIENPTFILKIDAG